MHEMEGLRHAEVRLPSGCPVGALLGAGTAPRPLPDRSGDGTRGTVAWPEPPAIARRRSCRAAPSFDAG